MFIRAEHYSDIQKINFCSGEDVILIDHLCGFDSNYNNLVLDSLCKKDSIFDIYLEFIKKVLIIN